MSITAYTGQPGNGKTYEVVKEVILPAMASGRRIVTNIDGLHVDRMRDYLVEQEKAGVVGEVLLVTSEQIGSAGFFPTESKPEGATVRGGDLVIVDESWRWWDRGVQTPSEHVEFFRFHRHFTNSEGTSCDLVVITQDITTMQGGLRRQVESYYTFRKQKAIGWSRGYIYELRQGYAVKAPVIREGVRTYQKLYFSFYSSYKGKGGDERDVDARLNVFSGGIVRWVVLLALVFLVAGSAGVYRFFSGKFLQKSGGGQVSSGPVSGSVRGGAVGYKGVPGVGGASGVASRASGGGGFRVAGEVTRNGERFAVLERGGKLRLVRLSHYVQSFGELDLLVDGEVVNSRTGADPGRGGGILGGGRGR